MVTVSKASMKVLNMLRSPKGFVFLGLVMVYIFLVDTNLQQRQLLLADHEEMSRDLITVDLGGGSCDIRSPTQDGEAVPDDATRTLLASYPGSGKRFTWTIIKALTNNEVADDWNFSGKLNEKPLTVKTSWPHKEGRWSWGSSMDQVILLIRCPRWAIPSYHNMRFELDYATDWASSYINIPYTYTERPAITQWESWRDSHFNTEVTRWANFIDFWMEGGYEESKGKVHDRCLYSDIECKPKAIIDFENFYQDKPNAEFSKVVDVLETSANVDVIAALARVCVLESVFEKKELHQGGRPSADLPPQYRFNMIQHDKMLNQTIELRDKYASAPWDEDSVAIELVRILTNYIANMKGEHSVEAGIYLADFVDSYMICPNADIEDEVCTFMEARANHNFFADDYYPFDFPYWQWLKDRTILARLFYTNFPNGSPWLSASDHCDWDGVTCVDFRVTGLDLRSMNLAGDYPTDLNLLVKLTSLNLGENTLVGAIPDDLCNKATLDISGDTANCPNTYNADDNLWEAGCCTEVYGLPPSP